MSILKNLQLVIISIAPIFALITVGPDPLLLIFSLFIYALVAVTIFRRVRQHREAIGESSESVKEISSKAAAATSKKDRLEQAFEELDKQERPKNEL